MIIKSIEIKRSKYYEKYETDFSYLSHIYSSNNSQGKTTLVRFIIYGLGFNVPITNNVSPHNYTVKLSIDVNGISHVLTRKGNKVDWISQSQSITYLVEKNNISLLKKILGCNNSDLLENILGAFYIDQESGWTVFNRGKVIGKIDYNIDKLIFSMSGLDSSIFTKRKIVTNEIQDYQKVLSLYKKQQPLTEYIRQEEPLDHQIVDIQQEISLLKTDLSRYKKQRKSYENMVKQNKKMWEYIDSLKISIIDGERRIKITKDNIEGLTDIQDYHHALIRRCNIMIADIEPKIAKLTSDLESLIAKQSIDNEIYNLGARRSITMDDKISKRNMEILVTHAKCIDEEIKQKVSDKPYKSELNNNLLYFAKMLDIDDDLDKEKLITKIKFHDYAGTIKQKMVLAYRCAALKTVSNYINVKLPLIIDSMNRETDKDNIKLIYDFLKTEFKDHQIIISTIVDLECDDMIVVSKPLIKKYNPMEYNKKIVP